MNRTEAFELKHGRLPTHAEEMAMVMDASFGAEVSSSRYKSNRQTLIEAFKELHGRTPSVKEAQIIQSIGERESGWGTTWTGAGVGSNNVGCVQGTYNGNGFVYTDYNSRGDPYETSFRIYPSLKEGAKDFIKQVTTRRPKAWAAMKIGDYAGAAQSMHDDQPIYYEADTSVYLKGMLAAGQRIANALGEKLAEPGWGWKDYVALGLTGVIAHSLYKIWWK